MTLMALKNTDFWDNNHFPHRYLTVFLFFWENMDNRGHLADYHLNHFVHLVIERPLLRIGTITSSSRGKFLFISTFGASEKEHRKTCKQKYSRLRCLLCVKGLVIGFYLGWSGSTLLITKHIIKVGSKS